MSKRTAEYKQALQNARAHAEQRQRDMQLVRAQRVAALLHHAQDQLNDMLLVGKALQRKADNSAAQAAHKQLLEAAAQTQALLRVCDQLNNNALTAAALDTDTDTLAARTALIERLIHLIERTL